MGVVRGVLVVVGVVVLAAVAVAMRPAWVGPPGLCHPLEIGDAASLPFGKGSWTAVDPSFDRARTVPVTIALLDGSEASLVHMETLRRAVVYLTREDRFDDATHVAVFVAALEERVAAAGEDARPVPATFDLGYALALLGELGHRPRDAGLARRLVEQAAAERPDDGARRLGAAIAAHARGDDAALREHLRAALARDVDDLLQQNICTTMGPWFRAHSRADLLAALDR